MKFRTEIDIPKPSFSIEPADEMLFVGSCFADNIGRRFRDDGFRCTVNPYGTMYNPASVLHTVERWLKERCEEQKRKEEIGINGDTHLHANDNHQAADTSHSPSLITGGGWGVGLAILTLGTNHVYILKETGEIVDNCQKRPQRLFEERELTIDECAMYLERTIDLLRSVNPDVKIILTVSPIRYAKYGYHESQLSKATLLLAIDKVQKGGAVCYFPSYEIVNDELRDYRFYASDMLHPSEQAVDYIYERFSSLYFSPAAHQMVSEWRPIHAALHHRPFNPEAEEYKNFLAKAKHDEEVFREKWGGLVGLFI